MDLQRVSLLLCIVGVCYGASALWPTHRMNGRHTSYTPLSSTSGDLELGWKLSSEVTHNQSINSPPVISSTGVIYVMSYEGLEQNYNSNNTNSPLIKNVWGINPDSGQPLWNVQIETTQAELLSSNAMTLNYESTFLFVTSYSTLPFVVVDIFELQSQNDTLPSLHSTVEVPIQASPDSNLWVQILPLYNTSFIISFTGSNPSFYIYDNNTLGPHITFYKNHYPLPICTDPVIYSSTAQSATLTDYTLYIPCYFPSYDPALGLIVVLNINLLSNRSASAPNNVSIPNMSQPQSNSILDAKQNIYTVTTPYSLQSPSCLIKSSMNPLFNSSWCTCRNIFANPVTSLTFLSMDESRNKLLLCDYLYLLAVDVDSGDLLWNTSIDFAPQDSCQDSVAVDAKGQIYVGTKSGVLIYDTNGSQIAEASSVKLSTSGGTVMVANDRVYQFEMASESESGQVYAHRGKGKGEDGFWTTARIALVVLGGIAIGIVVLALIGVSGHWYYKNRMSGRVRYHRINSEINLPSAGEEI